MKKLISILCILVLLLCGCEASNTGAPDNTVGKSTDKTDTTTQTAPPAEVDFSQTDTDMFTNRDSDHSYDPDKCVTIRLNGSTAAASSDTVKISGNIVTITQEATYLISGTLDDGMLVVNAPDTAKPQLIFNGVSITSSTSAALYIIEADKVFLTLAEGSDNFLTNGGSFEAVDENNIDGTLFSKQDLTLGGSGSLTVTSPAGHGIVCKDDLVFTGGNCTISAASHGLDSNDSVRIKETILQITAGKDGIHTENSDDAALGFFYMSGGSINIEAEGDGISAGAYIQIADGSFTVLAGGGCENGSSASSDRYGSFGGGRYPGGHSSAGSIGTDSDSDSMKGLKAGSSILLSGGSYSLNTADDAIHANDSVTINGGTYTISSGDDAVHGEGTLTITACTMDVAECYEGLEAEKIYVSGGELTLNCSDDGLNAAGGTDSSGSTGGRDGMFGGGWGGMGGMSGVNANALIEVSGGKLTIYAGGDGLDSNGDLTISGGYTMVFNPKSGDTSVLDSQNKPSITGGTYIGLGITTNMAETFSSTTSTQGFIACTVGRLDAGTEITVVDAGGETVLSCTTEYKTVLIILSSPQIQKGETYTITAGENSGEITAN